MTEGKASLLMLPGLDGTEVFLGPLLRELPAWIEPRVIQYPPSGATRNAENEGANEYADLLPSVNRQMSSSGSFTILGWSFGGPLALMVAAQRPAEVRGVILCSSFVTPPHPHLVPFRAALRPSLVAMVRAVRRVRLLIPGYASSELRRAKVVTWRRVSARALAARARAALSVDARPLLRNCRAPLMYLAASGDEVISRASLQEILSIAPQTRVTELDGRHMALFTSPVAAAASVAEFMGGFRFGRG